ncbi:MULTISPECIES: flagellar basal body P-ring formation chaperone FlgA [Yersiniaceae]|uniref:flagellar basal body P-ring formation chaperone FlgA n=1 Tax=Yersiniaceae TaxID=1903411 RepID=UPI001F4EFB84|nr:MULTISPECIES: flagellar basal body P-ring formation chaperone FlgA [Yersiniaceae]MDV5141575.1 flagellar basal body P-ring formation chaperone FlgA [Chimaeribacter arupi]WKZ93803.1 flagellar basal body P-ring formation chaperone FlgA [Chimaeribacter arupi]
MRFPILTPLPVLCALLWLPVSGAVAASLESQIAEFFQRQYAQSGMQVKTRVVTPEAQWPDCPAPQLSLPNNGRSWGMISLSVRCGETRRFVQTDVQVTGRYWVAARTIPRGTVLSAADLQQKEGRLDTLPPRTLQNEQQVQGAVALRAINIGQPLTLSMVRRAWQVQAGQEVQVMAGGNGFNVSSAGKAMNNAAIADNVRVRMASGQVVSGTVAADGTVHLTL